VYYPEFPDAQQTADIETLRWCRRNHSLVFGFVLDRYSSTAEVEVLGVMGEVSSVDIPRWLNPGNGLWLRLVDIDEVSGALRLLPQRAGKVFDLPIRIPGVRTSTAQLLHSLVAYDHGPDSRPRWRLFPACADRERDELLARVLSGLAGGSMPLFGITLAELGAWLRAIQSDQVRLSRPLASQLRDLLDGNLRVSRGRLVLARRHDTP
jgi:hypothetical protein